MAENPKQIVDSIYGIITIPTCLFRAIIDTVWFQRLRRIEQMSIRALFPCARHDRFTHSLGVYHIGCRIVEAIKYHANGIDIKSKEAALETYKIACLLHDVGHSPFSHTFEKFYDNSNNKLRDILARQVIKNYPKSAFQNQLKEGEFNNIKPHELMSAYIALSIFKDRVDKENKDQQLHIDWELVARMIIGLKYEDNEKSFENALIDLIHGDIIDADGLDYVVRDSWASGFSSAIVNVDRLIGGISVINDEKGVWQVCYSPRTINEIEAVLSIKTSQSSTEITHHTVALEQHLLVESMKSAAVYHLDDASKYDNNDKDKRNKALNDLCSVDTFTKAKVLPKHKVNFIYPSDDDFVSLMKYIPKDYYVNQWLTRQYDYKPLWKTKAEFFLLFPNWLTDAHSEEHWLLTEKCEKCIASQFKLKPDDYFIVNATNSEKRTKISKVKFNVKNKIVPFENIFKNDMNDYSIQPKGFVYIFIKKNIYEKREQIIKLINEHI